MSKRRSETDVVRAVREGETARVDALEEACRIVCVYCRGEGWSPAKERDGHWPDHYRRLCLAERDAKRYRRAMRKARRLLLIAAHGHAFDTINNALALKKVKRGS